MRHGMESTAQRQRCPPVRRFSFLLSPQRPHHIHVVGLVAAERRLACKPGAASDCHVVMRHHNAINRSEGLAARTHTGSWRRSRARSSRAARPTCARLHVRPCPVREAVPEATAHACTHAESCMPTYRLGSLRADARPCGKSSTYLKPSSPWAMSVMPATEPRGSRTTTKRSRISWLGSMTLTMEYLPDDIRSIVSRWQQHTNTAKLRVVHVAWGEDPVADGDRGTRGFWSRLSG